MPQVSFKATKAETVLISKIASRAIRKVAAAAVLPAGYFDRETLEMDLLACHANGCRLDLEKLLAFPGFDFMHDVLGISRHMNRETGELKNHFVPRCARPECV